MGLDFSTLCHRLTHPPAAKMEKRAVCGERRGLLSAPQLLFLPPTGFSGELLPLREGLEKEINI